MVVPRRDHAKPMNARELISALSIGMLLASIVAALILWPEGRRRGTENDASPRASQPPAPQRAAAPSADRPSTAGLGAAHDAQASPGPAPLGLFARLALSPEQQRLLHEADESEVALCMRERGFAYVQNSPDDDTADDDAARVQPEPGDVEAARAHGYGLAERMETPEIPPPDANAEQVGKLSPDAQRAWSDALAGPPIEPTGPADVAGVRTITTPGGSMLQWHESSCLARARRAVYGDDVEHAELIVGLDELRGEVDQMTHGDPAYRAGVERWRACMGARGLSHDEPGDAADALAEEFQQGRIGLAELRQREAQVATADAECFGEAGLARLLDAARARAEVAVERNHQGVLDDYIALQTGALAHAEQLTHR